MGLEGWIDFDTIRACVRHATGAIPALLIFALVGLVIRLIIIKGTLRGILETIDGLALVGLFLWLVYQMGCILWNRREKVRGGFHVLAA
jgi:hypothetical protein